MLKSELRKYFNGIFETKITAIYAKYHAIYAESLEEVVKRTMENQDVKDLVTSTDLMVDAQQKLTGQFDFLESWHLTQVISNASNFESKLKHKLKDSLRYVVMNYDEITTNNLDGFYGLFTKRQLEKFISEGKVIRNEYNQVIALRREIESVISAAHNAKRAYKDLIALGVNMSGFEEADKNLPAIVKLSVDPSIINETVEGK